LDSWNSKPQNIEQEISNDEVGNRCAQSFFKNNNGRIPYLNIRYSFFQSFFIDLNGRFSSQWQRYTLNPEPAWPLYPTSSVAYLPEATVANLPTST